VRHAFQRASTACESEVHANSIDEPRSSPETSPVSDVIEMDDEDYNIMIESLNKNPDNSQTSCNLELEDLFKAVGPVVPALHTTQPSNDATLSLNNDHYASPLSQLPLAFSFAQLGPSAYLDITKNAPAIERGLHLQKTNSIFSDHINSVEHFCREKWTNHNTLLSRTDEE
jgi:hypothetical protein